jgi:ubiquinone biosynthesis protein COQ9
MSHAATETTMTMPFDETRDKILDAAVMHVPFDGWSDATLAAAAADAGVDLAAARAMFPRGAVDLALAFHDRGDRAMIERLRSEDLSALKFREKIAAAVRFRLEAVEDKELVRRGATLFALPNHAADGANVRGGEDLYRPMPRPHPTRDVAEA